MTIRVLRMKDLPEKVGLGKSALYEMIARGAFPRGFQISARAVGWREHDIDAWITQRAGVPEAANH